MRKFIWGATGIVIGFPKLEFFTNPEKVNLTSYVDICFGSSDGPFPRNGKQMEAPCVRRCNSLEEDVLMGSVLLTRLSMIKLKWRYSVGSI